MRPMNISKSHLGGSIFLLLLVVLSQARLFDMFLNSVIGRALFLLVILSISYFNKILGIVGVLLFIIVFNMQHEQNTFYEGFSSDSGGSDDSSDASGNSMDSSGNMMDASGNINIPKICKTLASKAKSSQSEGFRSIEGFDILGNESTLQRGKRSNCISVVKSSSNNVEPAESFTQNTMIYSKF